MTFELSKMKYITEFRELNKYLIKFENHGVIFGYFKDFAMYSKSSFEKTAQFLNAIQQ